jgi:hypothetical protein
MSRKSPKNAPAGAAARTRPSAPGTALVLRAPDAKGAVTLTAEGFALVEAVARNGGSQALCASRLGMALSDCTRAKCRIRYDATSNARKGGDAAGQCF